MNVDTLISRFQSVDKETRLEALLDAARTLPPLPDRLASSRDRETHRVAECQTPVFLWIENDNGQIRISADVPRESPTVRGFVSLMVKVLNGKPPEALANLPADIIHQLRLEESIGMNRTQGLTAIVNRLRRTGQALTA